MNYVKLSWSNSCNIPPAFYTDGFMNSLYFVEDFSPDYGVKVDGKEAKGKINLEKIVWKKNLIITVQTSPATAEILSTIPLHDNVYLQDKNGDVYNCAGADVEVDISKAGYEILSEKEHAIVSVTLTFLVEVLTKTGCCDLSLQEITCSDVAPTIKSIAEPVAGTMLLTGGCPANMYVRWLCRERHKPILITPSANIKDVAIISETVILYVAEDGRIYKSTDSGNTYSLIYTDANGINKIDYNSGNYAYYGTNTGEVKRINVNNNTVTSLGTPAMYEITAVAVGATKSYFGYGSGQVFKYEAGIFTEITGGFGSVINIALKTDSVLTIVYANYLMYTGNSGVSFSVVNMSAYLLTFGLYYENDYYLISTNIGKVYTINPAVGIGTLNEIIDVEIPINSMALVLTGLTTYLYLGGQYLFYCEVEDWTRGKIKIYDETTIVSLKGSMIYDNLLISSMSVYIGTSKAIYENFGFKIYEEFNADGFTKIAENNVSYEMYLQSYLPNSDCADSDHEFFTT